MIAARSTVLNNLEGGKQYMGFPAIPNFQAKRQLIAAQQLPELIKRVRELEKQLANKGKPAAGDV
jgi:UDP-3-O-[3-hydroxymyristoyl] glucosamine N-acyltransferase